MKMNARRWTMAAGLCALLAGLTITGGCGRNPVGSTPVGNPSETVATNNTNGAVRIPVTREQVTRFGIMIAPATTGSVVRTLRVPGEIKLDPDRVVRVVPTAPGIVRQVVKTLGDSVQKGDILAWIESAELAAARAGYRAAEKIHAREIELRASAVNSEQDLLMAETALVQARAALHALLDTAARVKVLTDEDATRADNGDPSGAKRLGEGERFAWYELTAPFAGTVTERQITQGERVDTVARVFTIADLSSVWAELALGQDRVADVREGHAMTIHLSDGARRETTLQYVSPVVDPETRTVTVRATVNNDGGQFRPGAFIEGVILMPSDREAVLVPKDAVQLVYDHTCVFVWDAGTFELREVQTGTTDGQQIEILKGLQAGERVAAVNAFHLKAEYIKTAAGDLGAGHGHPH